MRPVDGLSRQQADLVWMLYDAAPTPLTTEALAERLGSTPNSVKVQVCRIRGRRPDFTIKRTPYGYVFRGPRPDKTAQLSGVEQRALALLDEVEWRPMGLKAAREAGFESAGNLSNALRALEKRGLVEVCELNARNLAYRKRKNAWLS